MSTTEKMTVHKALVELKTLDSRISKATTEVPFVLANKHANTKISGIPVSEYCENMKSAYQRVRDLIARRDAIKRAVVMSNATTKVTIGSDEFTVAEAIEMKNHGIGYYQSLLNVMSNSYRRAQRDADVNNGDALEERADEYIKSMYGNATDLKNLTEDIKRVRADFIAAQTYELVDPIKVKEQMESLESDISTFMVEVDAALSVSNAITEIEIEY